MAHTKVLGAKLSLHDVDDVEGLAGAVLEERLRLWRVYLKPHLHEEAIAYLVATAWELSEKFDAARSSSFAAYAGASLRLRLVDWFRATFGDSRYGRRPEPLSIDYRDELEAAFGSSSRGRDLDELLVDPVDVHEAALAALGLGIEWGTISLPGLATVREIGIPLSRGASLEAIARGLGQSRRRVEQRIEELRDELLAGNPGLEEWFV